MAIIPRIEVLTRNYRKSRDLASYTHWLDSRMNATLEFKRSTGELTFEICDRNNSDGDLSGGFWTLEVVRNGQSAKYTIEIQYFSYGFGGAYYEAEWSSKDYADLKDVSELQLYLYKQ